MSKDAHKLLQEIECLGNPWLEMTQCVTVEGILSDVRQLTVEDINPEVVQAVVDYALPADLYAAEMRSQVTPDTVYAVLGSRLDLLDVTDPIHYALVRHWWKDKYAAVLGLEKFQEYCSVLDAIECAELQLLREGGVTDLSMVRVYPGIYRAVAMVNDVACAETDMAKFEWYTASFVAFKQAKGDSLLLGEEGRSAAYVYNLSVRIKPDLGAFMRAAMGQASFSRAVLTPLAGYEEE